MPFIVRWQIVTKVTRNLDLEFDDEWSAEDFAETLRRSEYAHQITVEKNND